jgi:hypothetical protein
MAQGFSGHPRLPSCVASGSAVQSRGEPPSPASAGEPARVGPTALSPRSRRRSARIARLPACREACLLPDPGLSRFAGTTTHSREERLALSRWCVGVVLLWGVGATELTPQRRFAQCRVRRYCVRDEHARPSSIGMRAVVHARVRERLRTRSRFRFQTLEQHGSWFKTRLPGSRAQPAV